MTEVHRLDFFYPAAPVPPSSSSFPFLLKLLSQINSILKRHSFHGFTQPYNFFLCKALHPHKIRNPLLRKPFSSKGFSSLANSKRGTPYDIFHETIQWLAYCMGLLHPSLFVHESFDTSLGASLLLQRFHHKNKDVVLAF